MAAINCIYRFETVAAVPKTSVSIVAFPPIIYIDQFLRSRPLAYNWYQNWTFSPLVVTDQLLAMHEQEAEVNLYPDMLLLVFLAATVTWMNYCCKWNIIHVLAHMFALLNFTSLSDKCTELQLKTWPSSFEVISHKNCWCNATKPALFKKLF